MKYLFLGKKIVKETGLKVCNFVA